MPQNVELKLLKQAHRVSRGQPDAGRARRLGLSALARRSVLAWSLGLIGLSTGSVCGCESRGSVNHAAQSETAQSAAEYDLASDLWLRQGQPRKALEHALEAVELDDENAKAAHLVALLYLDFCRQDEKECRLHEAERFSRLALTTDPEFREARNTLGVVLVHRENYEAAIAVLKPLCADILYQTPENAWGNLGWAYLEHGQLELAIEALLRSTAIQPDFCVGHFRLGLAYQKKQQHQAAHEAYSRALSVEQPRCRALQAVYPARAKVALQLGRQDEAIDDLEECVHLDKNTIAGRECSALLSNMR